jgi:hypothetical protein
MENDLAKIEEIVRTYGKTVETISPDIPTKYPAMVFPQSLLPFSKEEIREALNVFIEYTNQDEKITESLKATAYMLTLFIEDEEANKRNELFLKRLKERKENKNL